MRGDGGSGMIEPLQAHGGGGRGGGGGSDS